MTEARVPDRLPPGLLSSPEMIAACRRRDFAAIFRLLKLAGIYPSRIARACDMTPSRVGEVMAGKPRIEKIDVIERIADGLHIPGHMLGLASREWEQEAPAAPQVRPRSIEPSIGGQGLSAPIDPDFFVSHLRSLMPGHYKAANLLGSRHALDAVTRHVQLLDRLQVNVGGRARDELLTIGARTAEFLGWLNQDLGDFGQALYWSDRAMEWAQETGDDVMAAYVLFRKSNQATAQRNTQKAVSLARAAQRSAGATLRIRALAAQQEAQGHALIGNLRFAQAKFDEAHELAAESDDSHADDALDLAYCTPTYIEMQRANCLIELGDPRTAVGMFEAELQSLPPIYRNDQGVYLSRLARAYAVSGEPEQAAAAADRALSIAIDTESARAMAELFAADKALQQWSTVTEVATFTGRLKLMSGTAASRPATS
ncbi:tetratricopeptide repeat protein [Kitasatospora sp. NPDC101447]|uniref:tetratricopeptide repeat protein n=1 Tax=Kitasatospora sp. NPDC101447 TaxID=3364102 RepID=UPI0037F28945